MLVRILIPIDDRFCDRNYSPSMMAARRQAGVRAYLEESRLGSILDQNGVQYRILDSFLFAHMNEEVFFAVRLACDLHFEIAKNNIAPSFRVSYDDEEEESK